MFPFLRLLLSLSVVCYTVAQNSGTFRKPSSAGGDARISEIQNKLATMQKDILSLSTTIGSSYTSSELKTRLSSLEGQFESYNEKILDFFSKYYTSADLMPTQTNGAILKTDLEIGLHKDIQDAIETRKFKDAEEHLIRMSDKRKIHDIIHQVYSNSIKNFKLILDFSKSLSGTEFRLEVIKALLNEVQLNYDQDPLKLIELMKALRNLGSKATDEQKALARRMISQTMVDIKRSSADVLKSAMYRNTYAKSAEVGKICDALSCLRSDPLREVMAKIVEESFDEVASSIILDSLHSQKNIVQSIYGMVALFKKLQDSGHLNDAAVIDVGDYLKQLQDRDAYRTISTAQKQAVKSVISKLPTCVRSVFFEPCVWFYNLNSPDLDYHALGRWKAEKSGDKFYFAEFNYRSEGGRPYLAVGSVASFNSSIRYVYPNRNEGDRFDNKAAWIMELNDDYCKLKSADNGEYLFADHELEMFLTWVPVKNAAKPIFQWQLKKCQ